MTTSDGVAGAAAGVDGPSALAQQREVVRELALGPVTEQIVSAAPPARHHLLLEAARSEPVWLARLLEGHVDALIILDEAGRVPHEGCAYGVWASAGDVVLRDGRLRGTRPFCSGLGLVDRALVPVGIAGTDQQVLLDIPVREGAHVTHDLRGWQTTALAPTRTGALGLEDLPATGAPVGTPGWYLERPGFWHGSLRPAACWAGAAIRLVDEARAVVDHGNPHAMAHLGAMGSAAYAMRALLEVAGQQIQQEPADLIAAQHRALAVRHQVERRATEIIDRIGRALGPRPFVGDPEVSARAHDLHLYLRQDHAEVDLARLASALI